MKLTEPLFLTSDAAKALNVSGSTIRLWAATGKLATVRTVSGVAVISGAEVERVAAERAIVSEARRRQGPAAVGREVQP